MKFFLPLTITYPLRETFNVFRDRFFFCGQKDETFFTVRLSDTAASCEPVTYRCQLDVRHAPF